MRLIDADDLKVRIVADAPDFLDGGSTITKAFILAMIGTRSVTPTIDAVPVIRCKDCKHSVMTYGGKVKYCKCWQGDEDGSYGGDPLYLEGDFYCAAAKKKED